MSEIKKEQSKEFEESDLIVTLKKPFTFEGKAYDSIDLTGLEDLTGMNLIETEKMLRTKGVSSLNPEFTTEGLLMYAAVASKMPIEFFNVLPLREARKVKVRVMNFFLE